MHLITLFPCDWKLNIYIFVCLLKWKKFWIQHFLDDFIWVDVESSWVIDAKQWLVLLYLPTQFKQVHMQDQWQISNSVTQHLLSVLDKPTQTVKLFREANIVLKTVAEVAFCFLRVHQPLQYQLNLEPLVSVDGFHINISGKWCVFSHNHPTKLFHHYRIALFLLPGCMGMTCPSNRTDQ